MDAELKLIFYKLKGLSPVVPARESSTQWISERLLLFCSRDGMSVRNNSFLMIDIFLFWQKVLIFQFYLSRRINKSVNLNSSKTMMNYFTVSHLPLTGHEAPGQAQ